MKCKVYLILTTLFLFLPHCVFAEEETEGRKTGVTGFVLNQDMEPIAHAKVMLFSRTFIEYPEKNEHGRTWEYDEGEQTTETDEYGHYYFQVDPVRENSWVRVSAEGYPDYKGYYTLKLQEGSEVQNIIISNTARYRAGQYATIIMPTPPDAALGRFFRLDRVENGKVIFEREQNPQADVPYLIIPDKDFEIPCDTTLKQMAGKTDVEGAYLKGYYIEDLYSTLEREDFVMFDSTTDCYYLGSYLELHVPRIYYTKCWMGANRAVLVLNGYKYPWYQYRGWAYTWLEDWFFKEGFALHDSSTGESFILQQRPKEVPKPQNAAFAGFVIGQEKQPVANANVQLHGNSSTYSATTDSYGHFIIPVNDLNDRYEVVVSADGYPEQHFLDEQAQWDYSTSTFNNVYSLFDFSPGAQSRIFTLSHEQTGVVPVLSSAAATAPLFDLQGRRIQGEPQRKGVYIRGGSKYVRP